MKFEVSINTVNSASWMLMIGHGEFSVRTDKAVFNVIVPDGCTRGDALAELSKQIYEFNLLTPDLSNDATEITQAVCRSFEDASKELLKLDTNKPIDYYRSWTYEKYRTAVIEVKELV